MGKSGTNATFEPIFSWVGLAFGWGVRRFHNHIIRFPTRQNLVNRKYPNNTCSYPVEVNTAKTDVAVGESRARRRVGGMVYFSPDLFLHFRDVVRSLRMRVLSHLLLYTTMRLFPTSGKPCLRPCLSVPDYYVYCCNILPSVRTEFESNEASLLQHETTTMLVVPLLFSERRSWCASLTLLPLGCFGSLLNPHFCLEL